MILERALGWGDNGSSGCTGRWWLGINERGGLGTGEEAGIIKRGAKMAIDVPMVVAPETVIKMRM